MISLKDEKFINTAFEIAKATDPVRGSRIGAVIVRKNRVIGVGFNHIKSHPMQKQYARNSEAIFFHAEIHAIKNALRKISVEDLKQCTLYIARAKKGDGHSNRRHWHYGEAKPCSGCANCINEFELKSVVYTTDEQTIEKQ